METPKNPLSIDYRIREGLGRIATAMRVDDWNRAKLIGVNPTQLSILTFLESRGEDGVSVKEISNQLGVTQPSATESISTMERKGLLRKQPGQTDRRGVTVVITDAGADALLAADKLPTMTERSIAGLEKDVQVELLVALVRMIRQLQQADSFPVQRMCVTCRFFEPFAHADGSSPHHCHFVNASFGQHDLRIDCREHEQADPAYQAATWKAFTQG
ncbi:MarR family winged helix-turn-helix transcriptional regulator [Neorhizobium sp. AL 9.2.2]|uniref:MarR family winged helix-turn-helix transcriptional regulator n=1 Tax=Neorhizobium sp. AL 9.2.2 TaxID=2712894 RepID=UPI000DE072D9|nr:MarR family winged helix-turn-helix transcriptional regulator [Neorhizobium sp. AL 9.2.2]NSY20174.1 winged helix-turn-helix transcriptional regulator [Neorhizobium sp. AL 9.2.2]